ncbi:Bug family tripartite tricarboxylate transporter substrate binding protein [Bordetella trematum]|uniref:Bug family tripartite tricarboxylate transporter substrate binding protein n=1 Tax=Bordetella trematum TaxID=123899 RepID=UPI001559D6A6|nr:tripartite tricarboxylate transporter substrate binding protein [Bordetella trematum]
MQAFRPLLSRRGFLGALTALALCAGPAAAQNTFPDKPIRFIVPYSAGGTTDLVARTVGGHMAQTLGQPVIIENRGGAGGNIGMDVVAKSAPDGYTVGMGAISTNALNPHLYKSMPFDPRSDFTPIGMLGNSTIVLEVGPALDIGSVDALRDYARQHPGLAYSTAGAGTSMHLAGVLFGQLSGTEWTHVPYKGSAALITDLIGGQVPVAFDNLPASLPHIKAGKLRALAVAGAERSPALPDVPTLAEAGLPGYAVEPWFGVYAPAGVPAPAVQRLESALQAALADPAVKEKLLAAGFSPRASSAAELGTLTASEYERLGKVARDAGMSLD